MVRGDRQNAPVTFVDAHGIRIETHEWLVPDPRAVVQISHGIGEHAGRYAALAADLNAAGFAVVADDHRGHGSTGRAASGGATPPSSGTLGPGGLRATDRRDRGRSAELHPRALPGRAARAPRAQLGIADGADRAEPRPDDCDGLVLSGTAYRLPGLHGRGRPEPQAPCLRHDRGGVAEPRPGGRAAVGRGSAHLPRADVEAARRCATPSACSAGPPGGSARRPARCCCRWVGDDTLGGGRSVERLARAYRERSGLADVTVSVYDGARHEVFNETNRDEVIADLVGLDRGRTS